MPQTRHAKVLIVGSGPAGYTAAVYAARAALDPVLVTGIEVGGQMSITTDVENYPGFADVIQGPWLMEQMHRQAENVGTVLVHDLIAEVDLSRRPFRCTGDGGDVYLADTLIVSTRRAGSASPARRRSRVSGSRPAPPATASSSAAGMSRSSAAATPRWKKRSTSPIMPPA